MMRQPLAFAAACLLVLGAACGAQAQTPKNRLVLALSSDIRSLEPASIATRTGIRCCTRSSRGSSPTGPI
jgi:hypothetical protein